MSQPDLINQRVVAGQKPKSNVYIGLMGMAAICLAVGCLFLVLEISRYAADAGVTSGWFGVVQ